MGYKSRRFLLVLMLSAAFFTGNLQALQVRPRRQALPAAASSQETPAADAENWRGFAPGKRGTRVVCRMPMVSESRQDSLLALSPLPPSRVTRRAAAAPGPSPMNGHQRPRARRSLPKLPRERLFKVLGMTYE